jgi:predicted nucleic-acid-binding Zn-ribbon protein
MKKEDMNCSFNNILDVVKNHFSIDSCFSCDYEEHYDQIYYLKLSLFWIFQHEHFVFSITRSSIDCPTPSCKKNAMCDGTCIVKLFQNWSFRDLVHFIR